MQIPFTADQFFSVLAAYNTAPWPAPVVLKAMAVAAVGLVAVQLPWSGAAVSAILALFWTWIQRVPEVEVTNPILRQLHGLRDTAEGVGVGEGAFYAVVVLIGLALLKRFPYRRFFRSHRLLPVVYLALVFHAMVLTQASSWTQPIGVLMALLMVAGAAAALVVLFGAVGPGRQAVAVVDAVSLHAKLQVLEITVRLKSRWPVHEAGQFAFVRFDVGGGAHPFTITSNCDDTAFSRIRAAARAAGVRLHLMVDAVDCRLSVNRLCTAVPDWHAADIGFCGPASFGSSLRHGPLAKGLAARDFHQELFNLR